MTTISVFIATIAVAVAPIVSVDSTASAQSRVGSDSATRMARFGRDLPYGTVEGLGYAGIDQWRNNPVQWGTGWAGYGRRAASNIGEFYIQEITTAGLAAATNHPLNYAKCDCKVFADRVGNALRGALFDKMPSGRQALAGPRIVGAYVGSLAQASWRPTPPIGRLQTALINGTTSFATGALINLYHEFR
ncbi:MAG: hypothetical protein ABI442_00295 [Gemmatimonadaceae bacterium]